MRENNIEYIQKLSDYYGVDSLQEKEIKKGQDKKILYNLTMKNGQKFTINSKEKELLNL